MTRGAEFFETAKQMGIELERKPADRIVVIGTAALTPLGNTEQTLEGLNTGKSGIKAYDVSNWATNIAGAIDFDPEKYGFTKKEMREKAPLTAMAIVLAREALKKAGLLGEDGKLRKDIKGEDVASWMGSGFGSSNNVIDVYTRIHSADDPKDTSEERGAKMIENSRKIPPRSGLQTFPEEMNAGVAEAIGAVGGEGGSEVAACATGLVNIYDAIDTIKSGRAKIAVAGGVEDVLSSHKEIGIGLFAALRAVSKRNGEPQKASRPFDKDRDGFVLSAGGGAIVLAEHKYALKIGAPILVEVLGFQRSIDGSDPVNLNSNVVAKTILRTLYNEKTKTFYDVDAIFAHATSTVDGDVAEGKALKMVFGDDLKNIPVTAIKSNLGHMAGGAGAVNAVVGINSVNTGEIPQIINLDNPDPEVADFNFVREKSLKKDIKTALVLAYGFGGHNAVILFGKYEK
jgi:3-oxoacyl-[acyl-carrier-protein] synthase II